jgi:hypothetical protein
MDFIPSEKATSIRNPSTANLLIDSIDRTDGTSSTQFSINKKNSIMNGFFTRLAVSEIVLDYNIPNVSSQWSNNGFGVTIGTTTTYITPLFTGFYTVKDALDAIVAGLNTALGASTFSVTNITGVGSTAKACLTATSGAFTIVSTDAQGRILNLPVQLGFLLNYSDVSFIAVSAGILPHTYIDFCSNTLTYNQKLKDDSTSSNVRDVLYRWVMGWDSEPTYDAYGYPILQGYRPFRARRSIAFPKQVRWEANMPIGQLTFELFSSDGLIIPTGYYGQTSTSIPTYSGALEWNMTLLVSEN